ncbi:unnamed protein product [Adineta steineri]|uniref:G-protein coupled receptors family 1 profile domain-containing protein n=1 Tax=Adineta steineri TaxID=433720 RepID=A0A819UR88_9BILA|nr:unnamed protein product [Adineta steineri]CAF1119493.1 unnamed protein product [Adineta steineri]CAF1188534.1 unnamed protein product [Adineta steineri]CAF3780034.1 unnamed protein product [Adineta steineri]CAF4099083.1 unnamed protein product [Adineta steineri]
MWNDTSTKINCYFSIFLFIFGVIGNILNTFVLSEKSLRSNSCAWLFLISSIFNLISILSGLPTRVLSTWTIVITDQIEWLCKLRAFTVLTSRTIAAWLIMLATFDRWLLSCKQIQYRRISKLQNAKRGIIIIIILSSFLHLPTFYCYHANLNNTPLKCYSKTIKCRIFSDQIYVCFTILMPIILMILFGFLTLSNIRQMHHRVQMSLIPKSGQTIVNNEHRQRLKLIDRHLFIMLLIQISFITLFTFPQGIEMIYLTITRNVFKSSLQNTIENSIFTFSLSLTYLASAMPFYIYTITGGRVFQQAAFKLIKRIIR